MMKLKLKTRTAKIEGEITFFVNGDDRCSALLTINGEQKYFNSEIGSTALMDKIENYILKI